jgi:DNA modification methylase
VADWSVIEGDCVEVMRGMEAESVQCVVTSPPYFGLRDYGVERQLGLEETVGEYVEALVAMFEEVRRVLAGDGLCWVVIGDCYATRPNSGAGWESSTLTKPNGRPRKLQIGQEASMRRGRRFPGLKSGDLVLVPFEVAAGLRGAGWFLRSMNVWAKGASFGLDWSGNPKPESTKTRPSISHEYVLQLSKSERPFYRYDDVREDGSSGESDQRKMREGLATFGGKSVGNEDGLNAANVRTSLGRQRSVGRPDGKRNVRSVWLIPTEPLHELHFAAFPKRLVQFCIEASCEPEELVLDPFVGSGTTGIVATRLGRDFVGIELNPEYAVMARRRIEDDAPLFNQPT